MCKSWCELIIGLVIGIFALFLWNWMYTQWVIVIAALILIIHSFTCKTCFHGSRSEKMMDKPMKSRKK